MSIRHLDRLLSPASVAVYGASGRPGSVGATVWRNLRAGTFAGPVYGVNPKHRAIEGVPIFERTSALPAVPDLALLCTPAATIPALVAELGAFGTRAVVVLTPTFHHRGGCGGHCRGHCRGHSLPTHGGNPRNRRPARVGPWLPFPCPAAP